MTDLSNSLLASQVLKDHNSNEFGFANLQSTVPLNGYVGHSGRRFIYPIVKDGSRDPRKSRLSVMLNTMVEKVKIVLVIKISNGTWEKIQILS